jgi:hypothetical protein
LLRNDLAHEHNWLMIRAVDPVLGRDAIGAIVEVTAGDMRMIRPVTHCYSYLTSSEATTHFGLGTTDRADQIHVTWPDGTIEAFRGVDANRTVTLERGAGEPTT